MYQFLAEHRILLAMRIDSAAGEHIRYVIRDTVEYYRALNGMLLSGAMRNVTLPGLVGHCGIFEPLRQEEIRSLEEFDVPRFTLSTSSDSLCGIQKCFRLSGHRAVLDAIDRLCEDDLKRQVKLIRLSWSLFRVASLLSKKVYESGPA
jgi:lantibiotic modifying enzyme